jgi:hypothetical protein
VSEREFEEQAPDTLAYIFERVRQQQRTLLGHLGGPEVLSPLYDDDRASNPHKVSVAAHRALTAAVEHLDALRALIVNAGLLHPTAPFTLIRAAIETGAAAVWVLAPDERSERVLRALQFAVRDAIDRDTLDREAGRPIRTPLVERRRRINDLARAGAGHDGQVNPPRSTDIVATADAVSGVRVLPVWRVCSGFANGRLWTTISILDREELAAATPGYANMYFKSSHGRVALAAWAALDVIDYALDVYQRRAVRPHTPPS